MNKKVRIAGIIICSIIAIIGFPVVATLALFTGGTSGNIFYALFMFIFFGGMLTAPLAFFVFVKDMSNTPDKAQRQPAPVPDVKGNKPLLWISVTMAVVFMAVLTYRQYGSLLFG